MWVKLLWLWNKLKERKRNERQEICLVPVPAEIGETGTEKMKGKKLFFHYLLLPNEIKKYKGKLIRSCIKLTVRDLNWISFSLETKWLVLFKLQQVILPFWFSSNFPGSKWETSLFCPSAFLYPHFLCKDSLVERWNIYCIPVGLQLCASWQNGWCPTSILSLMYIAVFMHKMLEQLNEYINDGMVHHHLYMLNI